MKKLTLVFSTSLLAMLAHQTHANPQYHAAQAAQAANVAGYFMSQCGGPTPDYCRGNSGTTHVPSYQRKQKMLYFVAPIWVKSSHPKATNMPLLYTTQDRLHGHDGRYLEAYAVGLQHYALAHCEQSYGKGMCSMAGFAYGRSNYVAVASPTKQGVNAYGYIDVTDKKSQAEKLALDGCQSDAAKWNKDEPHLSYNPKDCQIIYSQKINNIKGIKVDSTTVMNHPKVIDHYYNKR